MTARSPDERGASAVALAPALAPALAIADARFKPFPPGWSHLYLPTSSRRAAQAGLALYAPCTRRGAWAQRAAWVVAALLGPSLLPGRDVAWVPPTGAETWASLMRRWRDALGPFDAVAVCMRTQSTRQTAFSLLLLRDEVPTAFVKLRRDGDGKLTNEARALAAVSRFAPRSFDVPRLLLDGAEAEWRFLATHALPPRLHRPPSDPPLREIVGEIDAALADQPRPPGTPEHWRPMHGDFAPWNLRRYERRLVLVDWEEAGWAPPGADEALYHAVRAVVQGRRTPDGGASDEVVAFWQRRVQAPAPHARDDRLWRAVGAALASMRHAA